MKAHDAAMELLKREMAEHYETCGSCVRGDGPERMCNVAVEIYSRILDWYGIPKERSSIRGRL